MSAAALFVLVAVTTAGNVSSSTYPSLYACQEAQSIATTGSTLEEMKQREEVDRKAQADFVASHPPHPPADDMQKSQAKFPGSAFFSSGDDSFFVTDDGLIQDEPPSQGTIGYDNGGGIKFSRCFQDAGP